MDSSASLELPQNTSNPICESCGKTFSNAHTLKCHQDQIHQGIKNFQCTICDAKFCTKYKTLRHFQAVHSDLRSYTCDFESCGSSYKTNDMLRKHQRIHFPGPYECEKCLKVFKFKSGLDYHNQQNHKEASSKPAITYKCSPCAKEFKTSAAYENHRKLQHLLPGQTFRPKEINPKPRQSRVKTPASGFECQYCHKLYKSKPNFAIHLASHEKADKMQDYDFIISRDEQVVNEVDDAEQHLDDEPEIDENSSENLLKGVDEDLVTVVKFETEKFIGEPESQIFTEQLESQEMVNETVEALEGDDFMAYDDVDYLVEAVQHEDEIEDAVNDLEPQYVDFYAADEEMEQTTDPIQDDFTQPEIPHAPVNNTGVCEECGKSFKHTQHLKRHVMRKHQVNSKKLECDICGVKFLLAYDLKRHMIKHSTKREFKCNLCGTSFKTANYLKKHVEAVHMANLERNFCCNICDRTYIHERHLVYHLRKHQNDLRFTCDLCDPPQSFYYSDAVKWHKIRHHGQPAPYNCVTCNRKFIHEKTFRTHEKAHQDNGTLAVDCPICGKSISEKRHLKRHIRTHSDHKFVCVCGASFKERHQLTKHSKTCQCEWANIEELVYEAVDIVEEA